MFSDLIRWSKTHHSDLPWRKNRTLYGTLVSEIMLQQTTVGTVLNHFDKFLKQFPDVQSLSKATDEQMTIAWKGLGYYRRARNLKKAAEEIHYKFHNEIPSDFETLIKIPGIGEYTANALISIGMNKRALALDANLTRVIGRYYGLPKNDTKTLYALFSQDKILSDIKKNQWRELNEALMDLGRTFCKANKVDCMLCPLNDQCMSYKKGTISFNKDMKKKTKGHELTLLRLVIKKDHQILAYKKSAKEWLSGQFEVPTFVLFCDDKKFTQYPFAPKFERESKKLISFKTGITKYDITNLIWEISERDFKKWAGKEKTYEWVHTDSSTVNLATSTIKILKQLAKKKDQDKV